MSASVFFPYESSLKFCLAYQSISTNYVGVASMTILLYDHLLTFDDEVMNPITNSTEAVHLPIFSGRLLTFGKGEKASVSCRNP